MKKSTVTALLLQNITKVNLFDKNHFVRKVKNNELEKGYKVIQTVFQEIFKLPSIRHLRYFICCLMGTIRLDDILNVRYKHLTNFHSSKSPKKR